MLLYFSVKMIMTIYHCLHSIWLQLQIRLWKWEVSSTNLGIIFKHYNARISIEMEFLASRGYNCPIGELNNDDVIGVFWIVFCNRPEHGLGNQLTQEHSLFSPKMRHAHFFHFSSSPTPQKIQPYFFDIVALQSSLSWRLRDLPLSAIPDIFAEKMFSIRALPSVF